MYFNVILFLLLIVRNVEGFDGTVIKYFLDIDLRPFYGDHDALFNGHVKVVLNFTLPSNQLILDAESLKITSITVNDTAAKWTTKEKKLEIHNSFKKNIYVVDVNYSGIINNHKKGGLYKVLYKNNTKALLATHLEPERARTLFPCIDDPKFKAKFQLSLTVPNTLKAFSNTDSVSRSTLTQGTESINFAETLSMSTFLFAFVVGEFTVKEVKYKERVDIRVATVVDNKEAMDKVLGYAVDCMNVMEEYIQVEYPMNKLDHTDILKMPTLAMQNFGLITYSNSFGLTSRQEVHEEIEQRRLVCHETAHQWFSNIITTSDWGEIFLHEGFATFFENFEFKNSGKDEKGALEVKRTQNFQEGVQEKLFNGHAIISSKFISDETVYLSAGAVIQMIENVLGKEVLRRSIQLLIKAHLFGTIDHNDVIKAIEKVNGPNLCGSRVTVRSFITPFLHSKDVPVIKVKKTASKYILVQTNKEKYNVPLFISDGWNTTLLWLLPDNSLCGANTTLISTNQTLVFNYKYQSFSRFEYDNDVFSRYLKSIRKMDDITVFNILMDSKETVDPKLFMNLASEAVQTRRGSLVWKVIADYVHENFDDVKTTKKLKRAINRFERNFLWEDTTNYTGRQLQNDVAAFLVDTDVGKAVEKANKLFLKGLGSCKSNYWSCNKIPPDLRAAAYCAAVKSDQKNLKFLKTYKNFISQISLVPEAFEFERGAIDFAFTC